jgi:hypothetical protein
VSDGPDQTVYRTTDERNLSLWAKWQAENVADCAKRDAFLTEWAPEGCALMLSSGFGGKRPVGVSVEGWAEKVPEGWRLDRKRWVLVPFMKTARGKKIRKALDALQRRDQRSDLIGMPSSLFSGWAWCQPGIEVHDGAMFVEWPDEGPPVEKIDLTIWEPVKLSEWYAMKEAEESAKGEKP